MRQGTGFPADCQNIKYLSMYLRYSLFNQFPWRQKGLLVRKFCIYPSDLTDDFYQTNCHSDCHVDWNSFLPYLCMRSAVVSWTTREGAWLAGNWRSVIGNAPLSSKHALDGRFIFTPSLACCFELCIERLSYQYHVMNHACWAKQESIFIRVASQIRANIIFSFFFKFELSGPLQRYKVDYKFPMHAWGLSPLDVVWYDTSRRLFLQGISENLSVKLYHAHQELNLKW